MFLLFEIANEGRFFEVVPESLEVLIFGVGLVLLAIGLRAGLNRGAKTAEREMLHRTK